MILKKIKNRARGWRPLVLHWRRRRSVRPSSRVDRVSLPVSISYFPQIHLHFTTQLIRNDRSSVTRVFAGSTVYRERVLRERAGEGIYADKTRAAESQRAQWTGRAYRAQHSSPLNYKRDTSVSRAGSPDSETTRLFARRGPRAPIRQIQPPLASASLKSPLLALHTRHAEQTRLFQTHLHIRDRQSHLISFRSLAPEVQKTPARVQFDRAEELVWRRNQPRTTVIEDIPVANVTQPTQRSVSAPAVITHAQSASASSNNQMPQQITKLDPGLVDRLTDDVIRRVEKRARIERQRRGL